MTPHKAISGNSVVVQWFRTWRFHSHGLGSIHGGKQMLQAMWHYKEKEKLLKEQQEKDKEELEKSTNKVEDIKKEKRYENHNFYISPSIKNGLTH